MQTAGSVRSIVSPALVRCLARAVLAAHEALDTATRAEDRDALRLTLRVRVDALATAARSLRTDDDLRDASEQVKHAHDAWFGAPAGSELRRRSMLELVMALLWLHDEIRPYELAA